LRSAVTIGVCPGSFAEYAAARQDRFAPKPANLTFEQAAAVPISGCTALQGLRDAGRVEPGQRAAAAGHPPGPGGPARFSKARASARVPIRTNDRCA